METASHIIIAYYSFQPIENPHEEVKIHRSFMKNLDILCRIYISKDGVNAQISAKKEDGYKYISWLENERGWKGITFKIDPYHEHAFPKLIVKYRKELVSLKRKEDKPLDLSQRGSYLPPKAWKEKLENKEEGTLLIDVRNDYEWKVGHFEGARLLPCETFRDFDGYAKNLAEEVDPKTTPVMMYCTGGIRCEIYSSMLKEKGFEEIYQLEGGVIQYGKEVGNEHWHGKLFVFDDRMTVPISDEPATVCGTCAFCKAPSDSYYNCASMDCNTLFLSCKDCLPKYQGCCQSSCQEGDRVRPYHEQNPHKPFRKWYNYFKEKAS